MKPKSRIPRRHLAAPLIALIPLAFASAAQAAVTAVSWNFDYFGTVNGTRTAGIVSVSNWNNTVATGAGNNTIALPSNNLVDNTGVATTLDISSIVRNGTWYVNYPTAVAPGVDLDGTYNRNLLNGYLNSGGGGSTTINLAQIPYAEYDIYVYFSSDTANRAGSVTVGSTSYFFDTIGQSSVTGSNALFVQTTDTTNDADDINANYARFSGLTGATQSISTTIPAYGGIAGFQVVQVPEPAAALLGSLGILALLRRRREHKTG